MVFLVTTFAAHVAAQESERPLLSEEIRTVLERDGVEAAERRFEEIFPAQKEEYEIDMQGMSQMAVDYMTGGNGEAGEAIMNMVAVITQDMVAGSGMIPPEAVEAARLEQEQTKNVPSESPAARTGGPDFGPVRKDLARFHGVYGDPTQPDPTRKLFVTQSCDGHLVAGAMWGDAQNWWLTSVSDNSFEMSSDFMSLRLEFQLGPDGTAQAMAHDLEWLASPLERSGPLPEGWKECLERRGR
jgi:hypothetical protein